MTVVTEPTVTASAVLLREAASKMRELAQAATPGPWRHGDNQCIAGVVMEGFGEAHCAGCRYGEPSWIGRRDINGTRMLAHVHTQTEAWWEHGIFAERPDGHVVVVNDTDEYGYMTDGDARHIAAWHPAVALAVADWLDEVVALIEFGSELNRAGEVGAALDVARVFLGTDR